ncbi:BrnT family toxin [Leptospira selangorensis]|uniref:BrnT family toxin n=1 Tax=Leptospira selangorensis TaxID=2484982 RepID=A0A4R9GG06_9LEPT|nr:BrnT family toxin [Leptospira selangorensis]TGK10130.1 BrnT family toxin [Leptospira selangorensis]TGM13542.1 BrnT family toxin [Leptospira selangorensis]TGM22118.1 BrnT family toxin [Leptospira selangorensis]
MEFEWDPAKNDENLRKHGIDFFEAQKAFLDPNRVITLDITHSSDSEKRYYCFGLIDSYVSTVRFTVRNGKIRIFGAGYWRQGKKVYEKENKIR